MKTFWKRDEGAFEIFKVSVKTIREMIKKNCWTTWERLHTVLKTKQITVRSHKVPVHSGNLNNDTADLAAKRATREEQDVEIHNSENCRFSFTLKHRNTLIEENPRRYLKHLTQTLQKPAIFKNVFIAFQKRFGYASTMCNKTRYKMLTKPFPFRCQCVWTRSHCVVIMLVIHYRNNFIAFEKRNNSYCDTFSFRFHNACNSLLLLIGNVFITLL